MSEFDFLNLAVSQWQLLLILVLACVGTTWWALKKYLVAGIYDPLFFVLGVSYAINYGVILLLLVNGLVSIFLFVTLAAYAVVLFVAIRHFSAKTSQPLVLRMMTTIAPVRFGNAVFWAALLLYMALAYVIVSTIGFGLFAETNRFDVARGYGSLIRVLDCLTPFIVSFITLYGLRSRNAAIIAIFTVSAFILLAAVVNGAKVSVLFSFITVLLTLFVGRPGFRIARWQVVAAVSLGLMFSLLALKVNLDKNNVADQANGPLSNVSNLVVVRLVYRIIAFGDTSYLVLPNDVIDHLQTDSLAVRFAAPLIGNTNLSSFLGYDVSNYTVGRQAVLIQTADTAVFGGPTSHFDLFAYVYLGPLGGLFFVLAIGILLGQLNRSVLRVKNSTTLRANPYLVALSVTVWTRAVLILMEPGVGFAYIIDAFVIFPALSLIGGLVAGAGKTETPPGAISEQGPA